MDEQPCTCTDGIVCPVCATSQILTWLDTPSNPALTDQEAETLEEEVGSIL